MSDGRWVWWPSIVHNRSRIGSSLGHHPRSLHHVSTTHDILGSRVQYPRRPSRTAAASSMCAHGSSSSLRESSGHQPKLSSAFSISVVAGYCRYLDVSKTLDLAWCVRLMVHHACCSVRSAGPRVMRLWLLGIQLLLLPPSPSSPHNLLIFPYIFPCIFWL